MRLLHVICSTDAESGGPIEGLLRTSEVLISQGHEIEIVSLDAPEEAASRNFPVRLTGVGKGIGKYRYNKRLTHWIERNAASFDAIVLHGLWNYSSVGAWLALRKSRVPYFVYVHGMLDPWFSERYPLKHALKQIYWSMFEGKVLRDAQTVLFTCEEERLRAQAVFTGPGYRERVIIAGTADPVGDARDQIEAFYQACPTLRNRKYLLFLSRIHPKKACDLLIQAWGECIAGVPKEMDLVMAGPDQTGWVPELKKAANRLGLTGRIHWTGMLAGKPKWGAIRGAEALILPSHQENFGIVVAEAMACGVPVLISDKVNIWREVAASNAGLVEPDTVEGTVSLIRRFLALGLEQRRAMSSCARDGYLEHFSMEAAAHDFASAIAFVD